MYCKHTHTHAHTHTHTHTHTRTHAHTHTRTHTHTYMHTCLQAHARCLSGASVPAPCAIVQVTCTVRHRDLHDGAPLALARSLALYHTHTHSLSLTHTHTTTSHTNILHTRASKSAPTSLQGGGGNTLLGSGRRGREGACGPAPRASPLPPKDGLRTAGCGCGSPSSSWHHRGAPLVRCRRAARGAQQRAHAPPVAPRRWHRRAASCPPRPA